MNDTTLALIEQAVRAPSSHNTQPWLFRDREGAVEVHADRSRALPVNDPHDRELHISCGAALFNQRCVGRHAQAVESFEQLMGLQGDVQQADQCFDAAW